MLIDLGNTWKLFVNQPVATSTSLYNLLLNKAF